MKCKLNSLYVSLHLSFFKCIKCFSCNTFPTSFHYFRDKSQREIVGDHFVYTNEERCSEAVSPLPDFPTEAFHSTVNHFAPKMVSFSYHGMYCRQVFLYFYFCDSIHYYFCDCIHLLSKSIILTFFI